MVSSSGSCLWALGSFHTAGKEYPLSGVQLQRPPLCPAEQLHNKEGKTTALSTALLHRLSAHLFPFWHLKGALNRQEKHHTVPGALISEDD